MADAGRRRLDRGARTPADSPELDMSRSSRLDQRELASNRPRERSRRRRPPVSERSRARGAGRPVGVEGVGRSRPPTYAGFRLDVGDRTDRALRPEPGDLRGQLGRHRSRLHQQTCAGRRRLLVHCSTTKALASGRRPVAARLIRSATAAGPRGCSCAHGGGSRSTVYRPPAGTLSWPAEVPRRCRTARWALSRAVRSGPR